MIAMERCNYLESVKHEAKYREFIETEKKILKHSSEKAHDKFKEEVKRKRVVKEEQRLFP